MSEPYKYLHTTEVDPGTSASQMMAILCKIGASTISMTQENGEMTGMSFEAMHPVGRNVPYKIPVRWEPIYEAMLEEASSKKGWWNGQSEKKAKILLQAKRTAWRLALDWLKVQSAYIQNKIREPAEVFLADQIMDTPDGKMTVGAILLSKDGQLRLSGGSAP